MNAGTLVDDAAAVPSGARWLHAELAPTCAPGARMARSARPFAPGEEAAAQADLDAVAAHAAALSAEAIAALAGALRGCPDPSASAARAGAGDLLDDAEFFELARFCDVLARLHALAAGVPAGRLPPACAAVAEALAPGRRAGGAFVLGDAFDPELPGVRARVGEADAAYASARGRLAQTVAQAIGREDLREGEFIIMRDRAGAIVPRNVRVIRETPAYFLCELELDEPALAALGRREAATLELLAAEDRARAALSARMRAHAGEIAAAADAVGELDRFLVRVAFTQRFAAVAPQVCEQPRIACEAARFLPLEQSLAQHGRAYAALDFEIAGAAVVTGPNMGGKTSALQTCAFMALCTAWGVPVPARRAEVALFDRIAWLGAESEGPEGAALLSSFGREVVRLRALLATPLARTLVAIDEFARSTNPREARALCIALLVLLRERAGCALLATHLDGVAAGAAAAHYAVAGLRRPPRPELPGDLSSALAAIGAAMDYRLVRASEDDPAPQDAIALAGLLGLDDGFIASAQAALAARPRE